MPTVKDALNNMTPAERDGLLLENAAAEINAGKGQPKAEAKPRKKSAEPNPKKQSSNVNLEGDTATLVKWKTFVDVSGLSLKKAGSEDIYLRVEAWNYLFALEKLTPTVVDMSRYELEDNKTLYVAKAALIPKTKDAPIITAFGACKVGENDYCKDDFSALSMAQTRAIGKLGRTAFGHLATACGFKATPWEEVSSK